MYKLVLAVNLSLAARVRRNGETHTVAVGQEVEMEEHTNCSNTETVNDSMNCEMDNYHEICTSNSCDYQSGGNIAAWKCDCSVVYGPIQFYDASKCEWKGTTKTCPVTTTTLPETTEAETTTRLTTTWTTTTRRRRRMLRGKRPARAKQCTSLVTPWSCSMGARNGSLCTKVCPGQNQQFEKKRCVCFNTRCDWEIRGRGCVKQRDKPRIMGRSGSSPIGSMTGSSVNDVMAGFSGLSQIGESLQRLFAQIANFNLHSSTMNFHW